MRSLLATKPPPSEIAQRFQPDELVPRRLHPAYIAGAIWTLACQFGGVSLYRLPAWKPVALAIIGH